MDFHLWSLHPHIHVGQSVGYEKRWCMLEISVEHSRAQYLARSKFVLVKYRLVVCGQFHFDSLLL